MTSPVKRWQYSNCDALGDDSCRLILGDLAKSIIKWCWLNGQGRGRYPSEGRFLDIGTAESYAAASEFFAQSGGVAP